MGEFLGSAWWLLVSIGVLVTFHEFGHFWVARRCGVKVLRFSVGFGKPIWSRKGRDGTEYAIGAIPLGGYVKMLDESLLGEREADVPAADLPHAFNRKPVWQRIAIVAAGPVANLVLCVALLWAMFVIGRPDFQPVVGASSGIAASSGLQAGDRLLSVDGRATPTWTDAGEALFLAALDRHDIAVAVRTAGGGEATRTLALSSLPAGFDESNALRLIGIEARHELLPAVVGGISPGTPAAAALQVGDRITAIDGTPVGHFQDLPAILQAWGARGGEQAMVEIDRAGERFALPMRPAKLHDSLRGDFWGLGFTPATAPMPAFDARLHYGPLAAIPAAFHETGRMLRDNAAMIGRLLSGGASTKNVSGPITIARTANAFAQQGAAWFLSFLALLSLSLAIINLLPIPVLDGGHLLYYLIELAKGSPLSERAMAAGQYLGLALLAGLMGLAFYNDFLGLAR
ncbi:MAG: RIP metalloprotease RseP [Thermomonas sp.]